MNKKPKTSVKSKSVVKKATNLPIQKENQEISIANPEKLISQAITKGLPVEAIEKLIALRKELKSEWAREEYFKSLALFQKECPVINKDTKVDFPHKRAGGRTKYKYATLDSIVSQVKEPLEKNGFSYMIKSKQTNESFTAICESHHICGHNEITQFEIPIDKESYMNVAQQIATAQTYAKRYAFCNAFGIITQDEDDDTQNIPPKPSESEKALKSVSVGFSEKTDAINRYHYILDIGLKYKNKLSAKEKNFFENIRVNFHKNRPYPEKDFLEDKKLVETLVEIFEKDK